MLADDHGGLELEALVAAERARLPLTQLARVTQRLGPPFVQLADLLRVLLLRNTPKKIHPNNIFPQNKRKNTHTHERKSERGGERIETGMFRHLTRDPHK